MLETAKVDVRRLQLLNDRINQTIDALNQLRLSVHGLQHTTNVGMGQVGVFGQNVGVQGAQMGVSGVPSVAQVGVQNVPSVGGVVGQAYGQLAHSTFVPQFTNVQQPWTVAVSPVGTVSPVVGQVAVSPVGTVSPVVGQVAVNPVTGGMTTVGGLSHTDMNDPYLTLRAVQTFPYLFSSISPVLPF